MSEPKAEVVGNTVYIKRDDACLRYSVNAKQLWVSFLGAPSLASRIANLINEAYSQEAVAASRIDWAEKGNPI